MSTRSDCGTIEHLARSALAGADGDYGIAIAAARQVVRMLATWKLEALIRSDEAEIAGHAADWDRSGEEQLASCTSLPSRFA